LDIPHCHCRAPAACQLYGGNRVQWHPSWREGGAHAPKENLTGVMPACVVTLPRATRPHAALEATRAPHSCLRVGRRAALCGVRRVAVDVRAVTATAA